MLQGFVTIEKETGAPRSPAGRIQFVMDLLTGIPDAETGERVPVITEDDARRLLADVDK